MTKFSLPSSPVLPLLFQIICAVFMLFSIVAAAELGPLLLILSVLMLYLLLLRQGYQFDKANESFRAFKSIAGFKWGKWQPIEPFKCLVCMHKRMSGSRYAMSNQSLTHSETMSSINLMDDTHLIQRAIYHSTNRKRCLINAERLSDFLEMPIKVYNPKKLSKRKSAKTRSSR